MHCIQQTLAKSPTGEEPVPSAALLRLNEEKGVDERDAEALRTSRSSVRSRANKVYGKLSEQKLIALYNKFRFALWPLLLPYSRM
jgi:hypothetical protein